MSAIKPVYLNEILSHHPIIEAINDEAFGPGRFVRAAERVREQGPHDADLSFVAAVDDEIVGSVRMTAITAGSVAGHLLGPLAVRPSFKNLGIGKQLVRIAVAAALDAGSEGVILVGDPPYYSPLGFEPVRARLIFPGPVDPNRILVAPKGGDIHDRLDGDIVWRGESATAVEVREVGGI
ncbi:N-acetyltransferase [Nitratireductor sp. XY-223]|uniref:GNAT family N-acetyltransferase n=1 Tax=Nitratireductor sp. XY-223 TaxID=2561926 RepID=UPI0010AA0355|nr:N-acetyltransferase [Nitratireductor sp. XY-223]